MTAGGDGSVFKFDPAIDSAILKELDEAEKQAKATAKVYSLKIAPKSFRGKISCRLSRI